MENDQYRQRFVEIVNEICSNLNYPPCTGVPIEDKSIAMEMRVNDVAFEAVHNLDRNPEWILVECHVGEVPEDRMEEVLWRLLHCNHELNDAGLVFGLDEITDEVMLTRCCRIAGESGRSLLNSMAEMARRVQEWNTTFFLMDDDDSVSSPVDARFLNTLA